MIRPTHIAIPTLVRVKDGALDYEERRDFMRVHRLGGKPCPRCGAAITEITANQRITSFCRTCQREMPA